MAATCKEAVGWMFARLDTSGDLSLEAAELAAINLDKYEVCIRAFFNSCDTSKDGRVSAPEWCFCFWRESASGQGGDGAVGTGSGGCTPWGWGIRVLGCACHGLGNPCCGIGVVYHGVMRDPCCGTGGWGMYIIGLELGVRDVHHGVMRNPCCGLGCVWEGCTSWGGCMSWGNGQSLLWVWGVCGMFALGEEVHHRVWGGWKPQWGYVLWVTGKHILR